MLYPTKDGSAQFYLRVEHGTVWLSQAELAELFQTSVPNNNIHIKNVLAETELQGEATIRDDLIVCTEGSRQVRRPLKLYDLDMILVVGYRVKSLRGTQFRQWVTNRISIHVDPNGDVFVDAPVTGSDTAIRMAVKERARWIQGDVATFRQSGAQALPREYGGGESFIYFGSRYCLKLIAADSHVAGVHLWGGYIEIRVTAKPPDMVRAALEKWLLARAKILLGNRLEAICATLRWVHSVPETRFQAMKVQEVSYAPKGRLALNPFLAKAPKECIDYVYLTRAVPPQRAQSQRTILSIARLASAGVEAAETAIG